ncbi:DNA-directed RNA polymerase specialized sigma subunit [Anaerosolibacter carboniphilus]|uniref:DNA-directed RNA polymerase specialized sigma subunit n=1 Tax=Anaerosolibacter carboniphilus TaxID=1417629 RepID=A0A841KX41_9FIRM|nr:hypothetical protein [Anaerosolibacter carboniphilus]MBB6218011.1 DNA-directed RNA polymerase specialized sigma subunit [Anaerosolibacter carboniphilus]
MIEVKEKYYKMAEKALKYYHLLRANIDNLEDELLEVDLELGAKAIDYSREKIGQTFKINHPVEEEVIHRVEKKDMIQRQIDFLNNKLARVDRALESLDEVEQKVIISRYLKGRPWYKIAYEVSYNERWCKEVRKRGISKVAVALYGNTALIEHEFLDAM